MHYVACSNASKGIPFAYWLSRKAFAEIIWFLALCMGTLAMLLSDIINTNTLAATQEGHMKA